MLVTPATAPATMLARPAQGRAAEPGEPRHNLYMRMLVFSVQACASVAPGVYSCRSCVPESRLQSWHNCSVKQCCSWSDWGSVLEHGEPQGYNIRPQLNQTG